MIVGEEVGLTVGFMVVGEDVGLDVGFMVVREDVGLDVGFLVGNAVGMAVIGETVGTEDGVFGLLSSLVPVIPFVFIFAFAFAFENPTLKFGISSACRISQTATSIADCGLPGAFVRDMEADVGLSVYLSSYSAM